MTKDDRIGKIGEKEFDTLCDRERLLASRLLPDLTGKDFIVEWPPIDDKSLDTRPPPRKCNVQIKSTRTTSSKVQIKLSASEWLVKDLSPSFIICPIFNDQDRVEHFVGFHLTRELLGRFLCRLRETEFEGANPRRRSVSLALTDGTKLSAEQVRPYLEAECGPDMALYAEEKALALKTLGYDDEGPEYKVTLTGNNMTEIIDCLMGGRQLSASFSAPLRTRFGISAIEPAEFEFPPEALISIHPHMDQTWTVFTIDEAEQDVAAIELRARSLTVEGLAPEHWRSEATNGLIHLAIRGHGFSIRFKGEELSGQAFDLDTLIASTEFWRALLDCDGRIEIEKNGSRAPRITFRNLDNKLNPVMTRSLELLDAVKALYTYCDVERVEIDFDMLEARADQILDAARQLDLRGADEAPIWLQCTPETIEKKADEFLGGAPVLITYCINVGIDVLAIAIAYNMVAERENDVLKLNATSRFPLHGKRLQKDSAVSEYDAFVSSVKDAVTPMTHVRYPYIDGSAESPK